VEFAKELFRIWDDDNSGVLDLEEIALPLVSLGLSTDSEFVTKLL
jgi:Ca2+-binding EF-hand superfamily protein